LSDAHIYSKKLGPKELGNYTKDRKWQPKTMKCKTMPKKSKLIYATATIYVSHIGDTPMISIYKHRRSQGPATLGNWPGSHGTADAGGERQVRTQGRRPVRGGRRRGREATGERLEVEPPTPPPSLGLPLRRWTPPRGSRRRAEDPIPGIEPEREWGEEQKICAEDRASGAARSVCKEPAVH